MSHHALLCEILQENFADKVRGHALSIETRLANDLSLDSLDILTLSALVEDRLGYQVLNEHTVPEVFASLGSFAHYLESLPSAGD